MPILPPRMRHRALAIVAALGFFVQLLAAQGSYYVGIDTASASFVSDLHALINPHTKLSYSITTVADIASHDTTGGQKYVDCVYSGYRYVYTPPFSWTPFSREHTFCHSWMPTHPSESGPEYSDLNHLFPTHQNGANGPRSNHPLGIVVSATSTFGDGKLGTNAAGQTVYEPRDQQKGDAARALFYMATAYNGVNGNDWSFGYLNTVTLPALAEAPQSVALLKQWCVQDPPDNWEKARNESVYVRQGNRNPFVDHPEYVNVIDFVTMTKSSGQVDTTGGGGGGGGDTTTVAPGSGPVGMAVVVNEYQNGDSPATEWVELLVLQDSVDLRGVQLRDHSSAGNAQAPTVFASVDAWKSVPHGTLIVVLGSGNATTQDSDFSDKVVMLNMANASYFTAGSNSFNISGTTDAIQVLTSGGAHIHSLGHGSAIASIPSPKVNVSGSSTSGSVVRFFAITDSSGFKSASNAGHSTTPTMGLPNDAAEESYIGSLLPVEMLDFGAVSTAGGGALLTWRTATEVNNEGWEVERRAIANFDPSASLGARVPNANWEDPRSAISQSTIRNSQWTRIAFVPGSGTSTSSREYSFKDHPLDAGRYAYRLNQRDRKGTTTYTGEVEVEVGLVPREVKIWEPYPNPFNPRTSIQFSLADGGPATLKVYNVLGEEGATLFAGVAEPGRLYQSTWDGSNSPSGVYFVRLESGRQSGMKRLMLVK